MQTNPNDHWRGYSLDELRYQRAITKLRIEIEKERLRSAFKPQERRSSGFSLSGLFDNFGRYFDFAILGFTIFRRISSIFRHFRR